MAIDDKLEKQIQKLSEDAQLNLAREFLDIAIGTIPFGIGSSIVSSVDKRRFYLRLAELLTTMKECLRDLGEDGINRTFFDGEEFQTLFALTLQQLQTTHDKVKLDMLATGLANSGALEFSAEDRKEIFTHILRDLSLKHIEYLCLLAPKAEDSELPTSPDYWPTTAASGETLAAIQALVANGLVEQVPARGHFPMSSDLDRKRGITREAWEKKVVKALDKITDRRYRITEFGLDFLKYFGRFGYSSEEKK